MLDACVDKKINKFKGMKRNSIIVIGSGVITK